jgi:hypothetical protein
MLRAWGMVARTSGGTANQATNETAETGAATGSNEREGADGVNTTLAHAGAQLPEPALTASRSNGPVAYAGSRAGNAARAIDAQSAANAASATEIVAANAQSATAMRAAGVPRSSTSASPSAKNEKKTSGALNAGAQQNVVPGANGSPAPPVDATGPSLSVTQLQLQIAPANPADSLGLRSAKQMDEHSRPVPASAAENSMRDYETTGEATAGGAAIAVGEPEESAAQTQLSATAAGASPASASRQRVQSTSSGLEEHKTLSGDFAGHGGANATNSTSVSSSVSAASTDKQSANNSNSESSSSSLPQAMARSSHEASAGGASAAAGQGIGAHVVVGQSSAPEASAWVRDPGGATEAAAAHGESAPIDVAAPQETFAALDVGTSVGTPSWIHAGGHQAEAGFEDPALGWVGVRADLSGGSVHAALVPGSTEAAQALSGHLAGLNAYLAEQHAPVATLTMAAPGTSAADTGVDQNMQQNAGRHGEQSPASAQTEAQQFTGASTPAAAMSAAATSVGFDAIAHAEGSRGTHISVLA